MCRHTLSETHVNVLLLRCQVHELQAAVDEAQAAESASRSAAATSRAVAEAGSARCKQLEKEADGLARDVAVLQEKLGRGEATVGSSVRILHLRHNPESSGQRQAAEARLLQLEAENAELLSSIAGLEQQRDSMLASTAQVSRSGKETA